MDTSSGKLYKGEEDIDKEISAMSPKEQEERLAVLEKTLKSLTEEEYDKYSKYPEFERPIARSFDIYMKQKRRWAARTPRDAFYAGYKSALADKGLITTPAERTEDGTSSTENKG